MKRGLFAAIFLLATLAPAHRLDEYLQNTLLSVSRTRVDVQMTLTPGVAVVPKLVAEIDTDHNGVISAREQQAYAAHVLADISLSIDGTRLTPRLISIQFPAMEDMKDGSGQIQLTFVADLPSGSGKRRITMENRHQRAIAAYQVNCLASNDPDIRIEAQHRNFTQSMYELEYTQSGMRTGPWIAAMALVLIAGLVWRRARLLR